MIRSLKSPSRRAVVLGLVALAVPISAAAGAVRWRRFLPSPSCPETRQWARILVATSARCPNSAARVGRHYLRMVPKEQSMDTLVALVLQRLPDSDRLMKDANLDRIRSEVLQCVRDDFASGRISSVQGWMLSPTEARLAALAALV